MINENRSYTEKPKNKLDKHCFTSKLHALRLVDDGRQRGMLISLAVYGGTQHAGAGIAVEGAVAIQSAIAVAVMQLVLRRVLRCQRNGRRSIAVPVVAILVGIVGRAGLLLLQLLLIVVVIETIGQLDGGTTILLVVAHLEYALILHRVARAVQRVQLIQIGHLRAQFLGAETAAGRVVQQRAARGAAIGLGAVAAGSLAVAGRTMRRRWRIQPAVMGRAVQLRFLGQGNVAPAIRVVRRQHGLN